MGISRIDILRGKRKDRRLKIMAGHERSMWGHGRSVEGLPRIALTFLWGVFEESFYFLGFGLLGFVGFVGDRNFKNWHWIGGENRQEEKPLTDQCYLRFWFYSGSPPARADIDPTTKLSKLWDHKRMLIDLVFENTRIFGLLDPTNNFGHLMLVAPGWYQGVCSHPSLNQSLSGVNGWF